jgi:hypothetical protein
MLISRRTNVLYWIETYSTDLQHSMIEKCVKSEETGPLSLHRKTLEENTGLIFRAEVVTFPLTWR